ncbi:MAG: hypothetical protein JWQ88_1228 [Rhodoferax sp.]|nr:hypothetical protein [Rhodoferax sp.]
MLVIPCFHLDAEVASAGEGSSDCPYNGLSKFLHYWFSELNVRLNHSRSLKSMLTPQTSELKKRTEIDMKHFRRWGMLSVVSFILLTGCATARDYDSYPTGKLEGKLTVQWLEPDKFLFLPNPDHPLKFTRSSGVAIQPERMLTDGGSIPRPLWILRNYSPWGYAPAFIVHDWLFEMKHCKLPGYQGFTNADAADVMAEVMKTLMASGRVAVDKATVHSMHLAVSSPIAARRWDEGSCTPPPAGLTAKKPIAEYELDFGK